MTARALRIFVCHPSDLLTDHRPHGDGLLAHAFVDRLARRGHRIDVAAANVALVERLAPSVTLHGVALRSRREALRRVEYSWRVRRLFESLGGRHAFDLVHQLNPVCTGLSLSFIGCGVPVVLGNYVPYWPEDRSGRNPVVGAVAAAQQAFAAALLVTTPAALTRIERPRAMAARTVVLPYGIDTDVFRPAPRSAVAPPTLLYVASLEPRKGIYTLLDAFEGVARNVAGARLVIAGTGGHLEAVRERAARSPFAERIEMLGHVERSRLPQLMNAADVFCMPSFAEPYGMSAIEAMACGLPIVATNAGGLAHLVDDEGGRRVAPGDARGLEQALTDVLASPSLCASMGRHNREVAVKAFAWDRVLVRLEAIYEAVLLDDLRALRAY